MDTRQGSNLSSRARRRFSGRCDIWSAMFEGNGIAPAGVSPLMDRVAYRLQRWDDVRVGNVLVGVTEENLRHGVPGQGLDASGAGLPKIVESGLPFLLPWTASRRRARPDRRLPGRHEPVLRAGREKRDRWRRRSP